MRTRPVIGVPTQTLQVIDGIPEGLPRSWVMNQRYFLALTGLGAIPWMVPLLDRDEATLREIHERLDGLFLPGGVDMEPSSYGQAREPGCGVGDPVRDEVEVRMARWAVEDAKPVLGVCRGLQVLNTAAGGSLHQDCATDLAGAIKHDYFPTAGHARDYLAHEVRLVPGSRLHAIYGADTIRVNSMHHQAIDELGAGLIPSGFAPDGLIEAVESTGAGFVVGVQWHPEMLVDTDAGTRALFTRFLDAASEYAVQRAVGAPGR